MKLLHNREIYEEFTEKFLPGARDYVWIATANVKGTNIRYQGRFLSFVDIMATLVNRGVAFRIIHAEIPSRPFRERYDQLDTKGQLSAGVEFLHCIRMHAKIFIVDGRVALVGSPNLTGAGIGAKAGAKRNFELAFLFNSSEDALPYLDYFDYIWMGGHCPACGRRDICPGPVA
jgi:phosphatidylserine/phosphatidylglycerophosphate/cardiolipin synthase-like enzyme